MGQSPQNNNNSSAGTKYYKSTIAGLTVIVGNPKEGEVAPDSLRFTAFEERDFGEIVRVGYLETDNAVAHKVLAKDPNVTLIDQDEYAKYTDLDNPKVKRAAL